MKPGYDQRRPTVAKTPSALERAVYDIWCRDPRLVQRAGYVWRDGQEYRVIGPGHLRPVASH